MREDNAAARYDSYNEKSIKRPRLTRALFGVISAVIVTVLFAFSVNMRSEYTGYVSLGHHHHLTGTSVLFANNWLNDGIFADGFGMIINPKSIEFADNKERGFYDSYPSGAVFPLYALAKISGTKEISFGFVQRWNMFNQYMITLLMALIIYFSFLRAKLKPYIGFIASLVPSAVILFEPSPYYFLHSVYFADQAVLLPFVLTVFLEMLRTDAEKKRLISVLEGIVIFFGVMTDYLFICLVLVIYAKRLLLGEITVKSPGAWFRESAAFAAPSVAAVVLFAVQLAFNGPKRILHQFLLRTGIRVDDDGNWIARFPQNFWKTYIIDGYGKNADIIFKTALVITVLAVAVCIAVRLWKKRGNKEITALLSPAAMIIFPCFMQVYLLRHHSSVHDFSALKFSLVLSAAYSLIPAVITEAIRSAARLKRQVLTCIAAAAFTAVCCVSVYAAHNAKAEYFFPEPNAEDAAVSEFVNRYTDYDDVVFSDRYSIEDSDTDPPKIALSMKRVYYTETIAEAYNKVKDIGGEYTIDILDFGGGSGNEEIYSMKSAAYETIVDGDMSLYKIRKEDFLGLVNR